MWIEEEVQKRFGSKRQAKEEILARYTSLIYMGNGQYGFASAAQYYFGRPLARFTANDADQAALLAWHRQAPRYYAPSPKDTQRVLRRRNQTLRLMAASRAIRTVAESKNNIGSEKVAGLRSIEAVEYYVNFLSKHRKGH